MKAWLQAYPILIPALWILAVPWLLFPFAAPLLTASSLVLLLFVLVGSQPKGSFFSLTQTPINSFVLLFLLLTGVAFLASPLPQVSLPKLTVTILGAITFYLLLPGLKDAQAIERLVSVLAVCAGLVALAGFFTLEWPQRQVIDLQPITDRLPHLSGSFSINYNEMAGTLLIFFPFVLFSLSRGNGRFKKGFFLFNMVLLITLLFFTQSRGAIMGVVVILVIWWMWGRIPIRKMLPLVVVVTLVLLFVVLTAGFAVSDALDWLSTLDAGSKQGDVPANSWLTRVEIWQVAGQMVADYPVIGAGLYTFDPVSRANYIYDTILPSFNLTHAHNLLLQTGASLGISGLLSLIGIWVTVLAGLWQASQTDNEQLRRLAAVFAASTVGYLFFNLYDTITFGQKPGLFVWIVLAGSIKLSLPAGKETASSFFASKKQQYLNAGRLASFVPALVLLIMLFSPAFSQNLANLNLDKAYLQSQGTLSVTAADFDADIRRAGMAYYLGGDGSRALATWQIDPESGAYLESQGTIALMAGQRGRAIDWYNLALALEPNSAETYLWRGVANEERGTLGLAEADYHRAVEFSAVSVVDNSTKAYIYFRLGNLLARKGDWQKAADAFAQTIIYQPDEAWYHRLLGDALTALGDERGAAAAYQRANN